MMRHLRSRRLPLLAAMLCSAACTRPSSTQSGAGVHSATAVASAPSTVASRAGSGKSQPVASVVASPTASARSQPAASVEASAQAHPIGTVAAGASPKLSATAALKPERSSCDEPLIRIDGKCRPPGTVVVSAPFGRGPDQLAVRFMDRKDWYGPTALLLGGPGELWVLDTLNDRLQLYKGGKVTRSVPLPGRAIVMASLLEDGRFVLYDGGQGDALMMLDADGQVSQKLIVRDAVRDGIESMDVRPDGVWLYEGEWSYRLLDSTGAVVAKPERVKGFLTLDGRASVRDRSPKRFSSMHVLERRLRGAIQPQKDRTYELPGEVSMGSQLAVDAQGNIYLGRAFVVGEQHHHDIHVFDSELRLVRRIQLPQGAATWSMIHRWFEVSTDGEIYVLGEENKHVVVRRY